MNRIQIDDLKSFCTEVLLREGMSTTDAEVTAEVLAETDALGTHTHGTKNLAGYIKKAHDGGVSLTAKPEILKQGSAYALIDGHAALGMVTSTFAMELACDKAEQEGVALCVVKNSCHLARQDTMQIWRQNVE